MKASLQEFLATGQLGELACGVSAAQVQRWLGEPEARSAAKRNQPMIWKYGSLQLHLVRDSLCFIGLYFPVALGELPAALSLVGWVPSADTGLEEFERFLTEHGIPFQATATLTLPDQVALEAGAGVHIVFERDEEGKTTVESVQYAPRLLPADSPQKALADR